MGSEPGPRPGKYHSEKLAGFFFRLHSVFFCERAKKRRHLGAQLFGWVLVAGKVLLVECKGARRVPVGLAIVKNGDGVQHVKRFDAVIVLIIHINIIGTTR